MLSVGGFAKLRLLLTNRWLSNWYLQADTSFNITPDIESSKGLLELSLAGYFQPQAPPAIVTGMFMESLHSWKIIFMPGLSFLSLSGKGHY